MLSLAARLTDWLEHFWEETIMKRTAGSILVFAYLLMILVLEVNRQGQLELISPGLADFLPTNHFFAVEIAFTLLLFTEVVSLIFGLTRSFSRSIGIQVEILCLILLRDTFKQFTKFSEPIEWAEVSGAVGPMIADATGALLIFVILGAYYRVQRHKPITDDEVDQIAFIKSKKLIALGLVGIFTFIGVFDLYRLFTGGETYPFFETFYTILIFTDVLMVLLSLRYSTRFAVTFRNFGYAVVTVFIRLALIAPNPLNVALGVGTAFFALGVALAYNQYGADILREATGDHDDPSDAASGVSHASEQAADVKDTAYAPGD